MEHMLQAGIVRRFFFVRRAKRTWAPLTPLFNVANDILQRSPPKVQRAQPRPNGIYFATTMQSVGRPKRKPLANFEGGGVGDEAEGQTTIVHTFVFAFSVATIVPSPAFGTE